MALQAAEHPVSSAEYQRGVAFLLRTQFPDGSWLVRTRTFPVQPPKDTGFPHGKHQWISAAGTSWAAMAMALTRSTNMEVASNDALRGGDAAAVAGEPQRRVVVEHRHSDGIGEDAGIPVIVQRGPQ